MTGKAETADGKLAVRPAWPGEAGLVLAFIRELAGAENLGDDVDANEEAIHRALFGPMPRAFCDIAEWNGAPVGFAMWFYNFSSFRGRHGIYLEDLFVRPDHRGRGIGKAMLRRLAQRCVKEGLGRLEWSALDWNEPAIAFYTSLGAEPMDEWRLFRATGDTLERLARTDKGALR